jgi:two-component system, response regulator, stage 0 sporulation protein A
VFTAADGAEALRVTKDKALDLIVLDLLMPHVDGLTFLRAYNHARHPDTKIIVFSNISSPELIEESSKLGVARYLVKAEFTPKELVELAAAVLADQGTVQT